MCGAQRSASAVTIFLVAVAAEFVHGISIQFGKLAQTDAHPIKMNSLFDVAVIDRQVSTPGNIIQDAHGYH